MKVKNHKDFAMCEYEQTVCDNPFKLGDVVYNHLFQIGVVIQIHNENELRTDMFGNACVTGLNYPSEAEVKELRPTLAIIIKLESLIEYGEGLGLDMAKTKRDLQNLKPKFHAK